MLPLREATGGKFDDIFVESTRKARAEVMVMYARPQIFMFAPGADRQDARDYALDLIDGGLNDVKTETIVQHDDPHSNRPCQTLLRCRSDPRTSTSDA